MKYLVALLLLQPAAARRKKKPAAGLDDLGALGDLSSLLGGFGDLFENLGGDENERNDPDDSPGLGGRKPRQKKKRRNGKQKQSLCGPGTFVAPCHILSHLCQEMDSPPKSDS